MGRKKRFILVGAAVLVSLAIVFTGIFLWFTFIYGSPVNVESITITLSEFNEGKVWIEGHTTNSGIAFSGYTYRKEGNIGYIQLRYVIANGNHTSGNFSASSNNSDMLDKLYIQGKDNQTILAWSREEN